MFYPYLDHISLFGLDVLNENKNIIFVGGKTIIVIVVSLIRNHRPLTNQSSLKATFSLQIDTHSAL